MTSNTSTQKTTQINPAINPPAISEGKWTPK